MKNILNLIGDLVRSMQGGRRRWDAISQWSLKSRSFFMAAVFLPLAFNIASMNEIVSATTGEQIYWGGYLDGEHYGLGDSPWETRTIDIFEQNAGKKVSIIHWGQFWHWSRQSGYSGIGDGFFQKFDANLYERVRQRGAIPMINWNSWSADAGGSTNQPNYQLVDIVNGNYDAYIRQWARDAKIWGKPLFLRFNHEMNGNWYPWSEQTNGNQAGQYVQMWRHVHDIFRQEGASNVTWVWSVNTVYNTASRNLAALYPGDAYVDWVAIDGYNWGTNPAKPDQWKSFSTVMSETYNMLGQIAPSKPIMLSEFGSTEYGGSKSSWVNDALTVQIPTHFPRIKAVVWFNYNAYEGTGKMDWVIESSSSATSAFNTAIRSSYYAANNFTNISGKVLPLSSVSQPTATAPAPTTTSVPPSGSNLLLNSSFETTGSSWLAPWNTVSGSGAAGTFSQDSAQKSDGAYSTRADVTTAAPTAPWGVQLSQRNLVVNQGSQVNVSFWARSSAPREIQVVVQMGSSPYTEYARRSFSLTTGWQQFSFSYTQPASDLKAMLSFNLAQTTGQVWIDQAFLSAGGSTISLLPTATPVPTQPPAPTPTQAPVSTQPPSQPPTATPVSGDTQAPTVRLTAPTSGQTLPRKQAFTLSAEAADNVGVTRVEFSVVSGSYGWSCTVSKAPYSCSWTVPPQPGEPYTVRATAYDQAGRSAYQEVSVSSSK